MLKKEFLASLYKNQESKTEALALYELQSLSGTKIKLRDFGRGYVAFNCEGKIAKKIAERISRCHWLGEVFEKAEKFEKLKGRKLEQFYVKTEGFENALIKAKEYADKISGKANLKNPKHILLLVKTSKQVFVVKNPHKIKHLHYLKELPGKEHYSLKPDFARLLINLGGMDKKSLLDPFAGTGMILLEAHSLGFKKILGLDIWEKAFNKGRKNLEFLKLENKVQFKLIDAFSYNAKNKFDLIVTDFPYGKSSHLPLALEKFLEKALKKFKEWLKPNGKAVIVLPKNFSKKISRQGFKVKAIFGIYSHKGLTRFIHVLERK